MALASRKIEVQIVGDAASLEKAFGRAQSAGDRFQRGLRTASKVAAGALVGLGVAAKFGLDELMEAERVGAQTDAALKSTGGAANVTRREIEGLAGSLSELSGVDDEAVQSGQNLLLTFTGIRNEVGKGNDIFNQATRTLLDMSVALGQDTKSSAIQLGKALNDPIKGVTALQRVGVSFTAAQKEQIKTLVESGKTMDAQKLILAELSKEFGGSAAAAGRTFEGQINKVKNQLAETAAQLVVALMPALKALIVVVGNASRWMSEHQKVVKVAALVIAGLAVAILSVNAAMKLVRAATIVWTVAQWALNVALTANPIGAVVVALAALAAAITVAYLKSRTFREVVQESFRAAKIALMVFFPVLALIVTNIDRITAAARAAADAVRAIGDAFSRVASIPSKLGGIAKKIIPGLAHGGPAAAGQPYVVGERGPELFVPDRSGTVVPARGPSGLSSGLHVENLYVNDPIDVELLVARVAQRLAVR